MSKIDVWTCILMFFCQKFCRGATLATFPLITSFTVITDHPSGGEVPPGRGLQSDAPSGNIPIISGPVPCRVRWEVGYQSGQFLALCKYIAALFWADSRNCRTL
jgi:hypothetical protein